MDKFQSKNAIDKRKEFEVAKDEFADFQGSASELMFLKFSRWVGNHRLKIAIGFGALFVVITIVIGYLEYRDSQIQKDTAVFEEIENKHKISNAPLDTKIQDLELFLSNHSSDAMQLRVWKELSKLYAEKKDWDKAAEFIEKAGREVDSPKEMKALYFYLAGNYRDQNGKEKEALENYTVASTILETSNEIASFKAWSFYQTGRLRFATGNKQGAKEILEKVLRIESKGMDNLEEVKLLSSYILLKLGKP
jgi:tetratricopeptide (TPR) repeat protein